MNCREERLSHGTIVARNNCREEKLSVEQLLRGTIVTRDVVATDNVARNNCPEKTCCEGHWVTLIYYGTGSI